MRRRFLVRRSLAVVAASAWMVTCGDPRTLNPVAPTGPAVVTAEISGPGSIAPGQSAQFTVIVHLNDGNTKLLTGVVWRSTNPSVLQVTSAGVATAGSGLGEATLQADAGSTVRVSREVLVLSDGTYRLVGTVKDAEFPAVLIGGAHFDVTPGSASATSDSQGNYRLYGVPADASVHIVSDGYQPLEQSVHLTGNATQGFQLTPSGPRLNLKGSYTLSIDAAPGCSGPLSLPDDLQHRSYQAFVTQNDQTVQVSLTEFGRFKFDFDGRGAGFTGVAGVGRATFTLDPFDPSYSFYSGGYPSIVELLSNGTLLMVDGQAGVTGTAAGLSGVLTGGIVNRARGGAFIGGCVSSAHQFRLTPR